MAAWHIRHGRWWMLQWCPRGGWLSLGVHVDFRYRRSEVPEVRPSYGPYVDLHLGWLIVSLGNRPGYTDAEEAQLTTCRGGIIADR